MKILPLVAVLALAPFSSGCRQDAAPQVRETTAGSVQQVPGSKPLTSSQQSDLKPGNACPGATFEKFLQSFASKPEIRLAYTAPMVKVAELVDEGEAGFKQRMTLVPGKDYEGFLIGYREGAFYPADGTGEIASGASPVIPTIKQEAAGSYYVALPGSVEGTSYRFSAEGSCWRLTEDPEPAGP